MLKPKWNGNKNFELALFLSVMGEGYSSALEDFSRNSLSAALSAVNA